MSFSTEPTKFKDARERMVDEQLKDRGISDEAVLDAFRSVPRQLFVNESHRSKAYKNRALPTGSGQTISQPYMVAYMTEKLDLKPGQDVLEVGTGSGYQTAILLELGTTVYTIEAVEALSRRAQETLAEAGYTDNVYFKVGDGTLGWPDKAPYDRTIVTAGAPEVPGPLKEQSAESAKIVIPVGSKTKQSIELLERIGGRGWTQKSLTNCVFVPLVGDEGWSE
jgi:protein-L-isoaspartate(D-aspartate) O-methyltransferase